MLEYRTPSSLFICSQGERGNMRKSWKQLPLYRHQQLRPWDVTGSIAPLSGGWVTAVEEAWWGFSAEDIEWWKWWEAVAAVEQIFTAAVPPPVTVVWQGFPWALVTPTNTTSPTVAQHAAVWGLFSMHLCEETKKSMAAWTFMCIKVPCLSLLRRAALSACTNLWLVCFNHFETIT